MGRHERARALTFLSEMAAVCERCPLAASRTSVVFGEGPSDSELLVVGEAPGENEDRVGRPFVGDAGRSLDGVLANAGLARDAAYVTNVVKCRPPANRPPTAAEVAACAPYLDLQLAIVRPKVVLALGRTAARRVSGEPGTLAGLRGRPISTESGIAVATYHPSLSSLNRDPVRRGRVQEDLARVHAALSGQARPGGAGP